MMDPKCYNYSFDFVTDFANLESSITGTANRERFGYWLHMFQYLRSLADADCAWKEYNDIVVEISETPVPFQKTVAETFGLPARLRLVNNLTTTVTHLMEGMSTIGELGT